jgi:hypothetical protein
LPPRHQAGRALVLPENRLQQLGGGIGDFRLLADLSRSRHRHPEPDDSGDVIERPQVLPRDGQDVERREPGRLAPRLYIELRSDAPDESGLVTFRRKHPAQEEQIAGLHRLHICAERLRRHRELDAKFLQPLLGGHSCLSRWLARSRHCLMQFRTDAEARASTTVLLSRSLQATLPVTSLLRRVACGGGAVRGMRESGRGSEGAITRSMPPRFAQADSVSKRALRRSCAGDPQGGSHFCSIWSPPAPRS